MKKVIISADDFGYSESVNEAIVKAHREGILTSTSLMVAGEAFEPAVGLARENPSLGVGLHLVMVCGKSVLAQKEIPDLVDEDGNFLDSPTLAGIQYYFKKKSRKQLEKEIRAQFRKFKETGLSCTHVDSHLHMHINPAVFEIVLKVAKEFEVSAIRIPEEDLGLTLPFDKSHYVRKRTHNFIFSRLSRKAKAKSKSRGFRFADRVFGLFQTGDMYPAYVEHLIGHLPEGISEIYFHPDYVPVRDFEPTKSSHENKSISNRVNSWYDFSQGNSSEKKPNKELKALVSPKIKELVEKSGIELIGYQNIL